mgnify:CR=1 FL=1
MGLLLHQAIKAGSLTLNRLGLTAGAILRISAGGGEQRQEKYQFTHGFVGSSFHRFHDYPYMASSSAYSSLDSPVPLTQVNYSQFVNGTR